METKRVFSGAAWEKTVAYCRAIKVGNHIYVSGTAAIDDNGEVVGKNDVYEQSKFIFKKIEKAILELGGGLKFVVRTRAFITDIGEFDGFARAHGEIFKNNEPAATCVEISKLVNDELLIEIEVDAVVAQGG